MSEMIVRCKYIQNKNKNISTYYFCVKIQIILTRGLKKRKNIEIWVLQTKKISKF